MISINYPNTSLLLTNGNTGTNITSNFITTPLLTTSFIVASNIGTTGNVLSTNGSTLSWITPSNTSIGNTSLNMNNNNINNVNTITCTNLNATNINSSMTFTNQTSFNVAPISPNPTNSNQLATKGYIDGLTEESSQNFYLNYSTTPLFTIGNTGYRSLSTNMISDVSTNIITTSSIVVGESTLVSSFITNQLGITTIPSCLFTAYIYGAISSTTNIKNYYFTLEKYNGTTITPIQTNNISSYSTDINSTTLSCYILNLTIPNSIQILTTDRLIFKLFIFNTSGTNSVTVTTYFQDTTYSYINLQISKIKLENLISSSIYNAINDINFFPEYKNNLIISTPSNTLTVGTNTNTINIGTTGSINIGTTGNNSIFLGGYLKPTYTSLPSTGCIGENIDVTVSTTLVQTSVDAGNFTTNYSLLPYGVWLATAYATISRPSGPTTNITSSMLSLRNVTTNTLICMHESTASFLLNSGYSGDKKFCSGIILSLGNNDIFRLQYDVTYVSGTIITLETSSTTSDRTRFYFTRIA